MYVGRETIGQDVDSSAIVTASGKLRPISSFSLRRKTIASMFSRPPNSFGTHSPAFREKSR